MKTKLLAAAAFAALGLSATSTLAATVTHVITGGYDVTVTSSAEAEFYAGNLAHPGKFEADLLPTGFTMIENFDSVNPAHGFVIGGTTDIFPGGTGGAAAPPDDGTNYDAVQPGTSFTLTDTAGRLTAVGFYMGSPDDSAGFFNEVDMKINGGPTISLQGNQLWGGTTGGGDQTKGFFLTYTFAPGVAVKTLSFTQVGNPAFEFDNVSGITVPEPASWALMIGGLGLAGASLRAKRRFAATA